jgi:hypothetical protein
MPAKPAFGRPFSIVTGSDADITLPSKRVNGDWHTTQMTTAGMPGQKPGEGRTWNAVASVIVILAGNGLAQAS